MTTKTQLTYYLETEIDLDYLIVEICVDFDLTEDRTEVNEYDFSLGRVWYENGGVRMPANPEDIDEFEIGDEAQVYLDDIDNYAEFAGKLIEHAEQVCEDRRHGIY